MHTDTLLDDRIEVSNIPNLDAAPAYVSLGNDSGFPMIRLPSGHDAVHLVGYSDVLGVLTDGSFARAVCNKEGGPSFLPTITPDDFLLNLDGQAHARSRRVINRSFGAALLERAAPIVDACIAEAIDTLIEGRCEPNLFVALLERVPFAVVASILGIDEADRVEFRSLSRYVQIADPSDVPELLHRFDLLYSFVARLTTAARADPKTAFLQDFFLRSRDADPPLRDHEATALLLAIAIGGDQNILTAMTKIIYALLAAPRLYRRLVNDPEAIPEAIEELIRLIPLGTVSIFPRVATQDFSSSLGIIPAGSVIYPDAFRANRDPSVFEDARAIDFGRRGARHLQFGYGMHNCMGAALGRLEIAAVLRALVTRLPNLRLAEDPATLPWTVGTVLRRPEILPVAFD